MVYLGLVKPGEPWGKKSRALAEGLMLHEEQINEFGIPLRFATDPEMDGWYEVDDETVDYSVAALEEYRKNTKSPEPGARLAIVNTKVNDEDRPEEARRPVPRGEEDLGGTTTGLPRESSL